jgi:hypothetical protein
MDMKIDVQWSKRCHVMLSCSCPYIHVSTFSIVMFCVDLTCFFSGITDIMYFVM